ncbi:hypothetical protein BESB_074740 [Besnoitia besnoiti]|uniref:RING-type domain-containing protein n=1 Tax=Besnoitia besnoiti TaxID=94643 RepID=A0A2A9MG18_BESBE|nr:uncharacterized protein BESB_074740 [Besnoitia besnoiti]PFH34322.1 hypothetical protein BESB_074740 [Besnoitia besnoiti]
MSDEPPTDSTDASDGPRTGPNGSLVLPARPFLARHLGSAGGSASQSSAASPPGLPAGRREGREEPERGRSPVQSLDEQAMDATIGGASKFTGLRSLTILVFGLLPLLLEIQLLLPSLIGLLDSRTWVYVHQKLNSEDLRESIIVPLSTAQVTFAVQQARRRAQEGGQEAEEAGEEDQTLFSDAPKSSSADGVEGVRHNEKSSHYSRPRETRFPSLIGAEHPPPVFLFAHDPRGTSLYEQLRMWHLFRKKNAEREQASRNGDSAGDEQRAKRRAATGSPLLPPAPPPVASPASRNSYALGQSSSAFFPLAVELSRCAACRAHFVPGVLPSTSASSASSSSSFGPTAPGASAPAALGLGRREAFEVAVVGEAVAPFESSSESVLTSSVVARENPRTTSAGVEDTLDEAANPLAAKAAKPEEEGQRGTRDSRRRLRLGVMTPQQSVLPSDAPAAFPAAATSPSSDPLLAGDSSSSRPLPLAPSPRHGATLFFWIDPEKYDVSPPLLLVYASLVVMMIRWFSLAVRALGEALLLQDDLDHTGAVLSPAGFSKPLRVVGCLSLWALAFCIFPYGLSARQGCMEGDMQGTDIPVPIFYAYFQYSIWAAAILVLVALQLSKVFKRQASAVEAEARRRRQDPYRVPPSSPPSPPLSASQRRLDRQPFLPTSRPSALIQPPAHRNDSSSRSPPDSAAARTPHPLPRSPVSHPAVPVVSVSSADGGGNSSGRDGSRGEDVGADFLASSLPSSVSSSVEQSFVEDGDTVTRTMSPFASLASERLLASPPSAAATGDSTVSVQRPERRRRPRAFTNATLLLMGYRLLVQRFCQRTHNLWNGLRWRRVHVVASRYHVYCEICSSAAFLLFGHTVSGALVVLLGPTQPWMKAVWLQVFCMFFEAFARHCIAKAEERAQGGGRPGPGADVRRAGLRHPLFTVGVGARASPVAGGTLWGYTLVAEPQDRLLLKQLSSTYFSLAEHIVNQVTASVAVASCCFPSPSPSSAEDERATELRTFLHSRGGALPPASAASTSSTVAPAPPRSSSSTVHAGHVRSSSSSSSPSGCRSAAEGDPPRARSTSTSGGARSANALTTAGLDGAATAFLRGDQAREQLNPGGDRGREPRSCDERQHPSSLRGGGARERSERMPEQRDGGEEEAATATLGDQDGGMRRTDRERSRTSSESERSREGTAREDVPEERRQGREGAINNGQDTESVTATSDERRDRERCGSGPGQPGSGEESSQDGAIDATSHAQPRNELSQDTRSTSVCAPGEMTTLRLPPSLSLQPPDASSASRCCSFTDDYSPSSPQRTYESCSPSHSVASPPSSKASSAFPEPLSFQNTAPSRVPCAGCPGASCSPSSSVSPLSGPSCAPSSASPPPFEFSPCEICVEFAANAILLPCGHGGCCEACARLVVEKEHQRARSRSVAWLREWLSNPSSAPYVVPFPSVLAPLSPLPEAVSTAQASQDALSASDDEPRDAREGSRRAAADAASAQALMQLPKCPFCRQGVERIVKIDGVCRGQDGCVAAHTVALVVVRSNERRQGWMRLLG